ncbi:MAG: hypothetical protein GX335_02315 [Firmicutes bacterium]|nr:hypothetical protein [Bacillota bacterium]
MQFRLVDGALKSFFASAFPRPSELNPAGETVLEGVITKVAFDRFFLRLEKGEISLSLEGLSPEQRALLQEGRILAVSRGDPGSIRLKETQPAVQGGDAAVTLSPGLQEVLQDLGIRPGPTVNQTAEGLLQSGLPLKKGLILDLLPWAEQDRLREALLLVRAGFPLTLELVQAVERLREDEPLLSGEQLSLELQELLKNPDWQTRGRLAKRLSGGPAAESLASLFVQERVLESLLNQDALSPHFVFALPFLLGTDLRTSWVFIKKKDKEKGPEEKKGGDRFRIELQIPTASLGMVRAHLGIAKRKAELVFYVEREQSRAVLEAALTTLGRRLLELGWVPEVLKVKSVPEEGWADNEKSCGFTLQSFEK